MKIRRPGKVRVDRVLAHDVARIRYLGCQGRRMYRKSTSTWRYPLGLLAAYGIIWLALAIDPVFRKDWLLENVIVFVAIPLFVLTARRLRFSDFAYTCLFVFFVLHAVGAHYTYSLVPYDDWWQVARRRAARGPQPLRPPRALRVRAARHAGRGRAVRALRALCAALGLPVPVDVHGRACRGLRADRVRGGGRLRRRPRPGLPRDAGRHLGRTEGHGARARGHDDRARRRSRRGRTAADVER